MYGQYWCGTENMILNFLENSLFLVIRLEKASRRLYYEGSLPEHLVQQLEHIPDCNFLSLARHTMHHIQSVKPVDPSCVPNLAPMLIKFQFYSWTHNSEANEWFRLGNLIEKGALCKIEWNYCNEIRQAQRGKATRKIFSPKAIISTFSISGKYSCF